MNSAQFCEEIKNLIQEILTAHQEKANFTDTAEAKAREAVNVLREYIKYKGIASLYLEYLNNPQIVRFKNNEQIVVWHKEYGLGMQPVLSQNNPNTIEPLVITEGDFPIKQLVQQIHTQLTHTLSIINIQNNNLKKKSNEIDQLIDSLKETN